MNTSEAIKCWFFLTVLIFGKSKYLKSQTLLQNNNKNLLPIYVLYI